MSMAPKGVLIKDILIILASILVAIVLLMTSSFEKIIAHTNELGILGSFLAGIFFTSTFTTAPAIVALAEISHHEPILQTAIAGGLGAVLGDLVLFKFMRDSLSEHVVELYKHQKMGRKIMMLLRLKYFRWVTFFIGGIIIASPLPDEIGISMLGFSKMKTSTFIPLAFVLNFIGVACIGLVANSF